MSETAAPLSHEIDIRTLPAAGMPVVLEADARERAALARANDIEGVESLRAELRVTRWRSDGAMVTGTLRARVTQRCVVSLEPVESEVEAPVEATFVPEDSPLAWREGAEIALDPDGEDPPETFAGASIDIGALVAEFLTLSLDPFPRREGVELPAEASDAGKGGAFAALAALKSAR